MEHEVSITSGLNGAAIKADIFALPGHDRCLLYSGCHVTKRAGVFTDQC